MPIFADEVSPRRNWHPATRQHPDPTCQVCGVTFRWCSISDLYDTHSIEMCFVFLRRRIEELEDQVNQLMVEAERE